MKTALDALFKAYCYRVTILILLSFSVDVSAQVAPGSAAPLLATHKSVDSQGIDLIGGNALITGAQLSLGNSVSGLSYADSSWNGDRSAFSGSIQAINSSSASGCEDLPQGYYYRVSGGGQSATFQLYTNVLSSTLTADNFVIVAGKGTLSYQSPIFTYTDQDGTQYKFDTGFIVPRPGSSVSTVSSTCGTSEVATMVGILKPDGEKISINYAHCGSTSVGTVCWLDSVSSSLGWMIKEQVIGTTTGSSASPAGQTSTLNWVAVNTAEEYCGVAPETCLSLSKPWQQTTLSETYSYVINSGSDMSGWGEGVGYYSKNYTGLLTNALGAITNLSYGYTTPASSYIVNLQKPSGVSTKYTKEICLETGNTQSAISSCDAKAMLRGKVRRVERGLAAFNYDYKMITGPELRIGALAQGEGPDGNILYRAMHPSSPLYFGNQLNHGPMTNYSDRWLPMDAIDADFTGSFYNNFSSEPYFIVLNSAVNGGYSHAQFDLRGNITSITTYPKNLSTQALVVTATYPEAGVTNCSNPKTCNKPLTITDQAGVTTTYTYDPTHGGLTSETKPAVSGVQAQIRYGYEQKVPYVKNSSGTLVANPAVWRLVSISKCMTGNAPACVGTADEQRTEFSGFTNNLLPQTTTVKLGDGTLAQTTTTNYDIYGNVISVDGPRDGNYDTTYYFYNALRQKIGEIGTDPDGSGARLRQATRISYNDDGQVSSVEKGIVWGTSLSDLNGISTLQQQTTEYSTTTGLPIVERFYAGGTFYGSGVLQNVTQKSYDTQLRLDCVAQRLNPAAFNALPASACTKGTPGTEGADRITKYTYDLTNAVVKTTSGYDTPLARDDRVNTFDATNGLLTAEADGLGNTTTYQYDDFKRPYKTIYPTPGSGTTPSTTDYTQTNYQTGSSLVNSVRLRDGQQINFHYDILGRLGTKEGASIVEQFTYNNFNQTRSRTNVYNGSPFVQFAQSNYNALGWLLSETRSGSPFGSGNGASPNTAVNYGYDAYGRRNQMTWPDGVYVTYDYTVSGYAGDYLQTIKESSGTALASFAYDDYARRTSMTRGNGVVTSYGYNNLSRLTSLATDVGGGTGDDISESFGYTTAGQVKSRTMDVSNWNYIYAPAASGTTTYAPNALNQIASVTATATTAMNYDGRGNLITDNIGGTFTYNANNMLLSATQNGVTTNLGYDAQNRLFSVAKSGVITRFIYDGTNLIAETDTNNSILRRYVPGPGTDEPIVWYEGSGTSDKRYPTTDRQGSVVGMTSSAGTNLFISAYDEYGVPRAGNQGRFQYTGQTWLSEIGLYYYKARFYNPALGRFMQADPIGYKDGMNWYAYVGNDPTDRTDPTGLACVENSKASTVPPCPESASEVAHLQELTKQVSDAKEIVDTVKDGIVTTTVVVATTVVAPELVIAKVAVGGLRGVKIAESAVNITKTVMTSEQRAAEIGRLRQVKRELQAQLDNGRAQAAREVAAGHTPNPHGLGKEINELIPNEIKGVQEEIARLNSNL